MISDSFKLNEINLLINDPSFIPRSYSRVQWTNEENDKIIKHVNKYGPKKWKEIAAEIKTKTAQQCRDHYNDVLNPRIKNVIWTKEEEKILLLKYEQLGPRWSKIKAFLPGRTAGNIKNYINLLLKRVSIENDEKKMHYKNEYSNNIIESSTNFSYHSIQSLLI